MKVAWAKTYLSGPMTGYPEFNYPEFHRISRTLRRRGWNIVSPAEIDPPPPHLEGEELWEYCMTECMKLMEGCDSIIMMQGWPESRGARRELDRAIEEGMKVFYFDTYSESIIRVSGRGHG